MGFLSENICIDNSKPQQLSSNNKATILFCQSYKTGKNSIKTAILIRQKHYAEYFSKKFKICFTVVATSIIKEKNKIKKHTHTQKKIRYKQIIRVQLDEDNKNV